MVTAFHPLICGLRTFSSTLSVASDHFSSLEGVRLRLVGCQAFRFRVSGVRYCSILRCPGCWSHTQEDGAYYRCINMPRRCRLPAEKCNT